MTMAARVITVSAGLVFAIATAQPASAQPGGTFVDDDSNHHEGMIEAVFDAGITLGCDPAASNLYCPSKLVSRGQMASFLVRALGLPGGADAFEDDDGSTHETAINALAAAGITNGCATDRFCPLDPVTRDQMASFLAAGYQLAPSSTDFFDDDNGNLHEDAINALAASGITEGCAPGSYCLAPVWSEIRWRASWGGPKGSPRGDRQSVGSPGSSTVPTVVLHSWSTGRSCPRLPACSEGFHGHPMETGSFSLWTTISG